MPIYIGRVSCLLLTLVTVLLLTGAALTTSVSATPDDPAERKDPRIIFTCSVAKIAAIDPILDPEPGMSHKHVIGGNREANADSTAQSLRNNKDTSCRRQYATGLYWFPQVKETDEKKPLRVKVMYVYYLGLGDQQNMANMTFGAQLIGNVENGAVKYGCEGNAITTQTPTSCAAGKFLRIRVEFPDCWDGSGRTPENFKYFGEEPCKGRFNVKLPDTVLVIDFYNPNGIDSKLEVSAGMGEWKPAQEFMHADAFEGFQPKFTSELNRCIRTVPDNSVPPRNCAEDISRFL
jgi:hypothetical protein